MKKDHILRLLSLMGVAGQDIEQSGQYLNCSCPLAKATHAKGTDSNPSFGIQISDEGLSFYKCYTCGSGSVSALVHRYNFALGYRPELNAFYMDSQYNIELENIDIYPDIYEEKDIDIIPEVPEDLQEEYPLLEGAIGEAPAQVRDWLEGRGISLKVAYKYETRYDRYGNVIFPTIGRDEKIYNMQFRSTTDKAFWYLKDEEHDMHFRKDLSWYGEQFLNLTSVVVVESQTDVLRLKSLGVLDPVIASCGNVTNAQLKSITSPIWFLGFDADEAGDRNMRRVYKAVHSSAVSVYYLDWSLAGIKDGGELRDVEQLEYIWTRKKQMKGGVNNGQINRSYKDKFAR